MMGSYAVRLRERGKQRHQRMCSYAAGTFTLGGSWLYTLLFESAAEAEEVARSVIGRLPREFDSAQVVEKVGGKCRVLSTVEQEGAGR